MNPEPLFSCGSLSQVLFEQFQLPRHAALAVAYSGGCDSTALLYALTQVRLQVPITLQALHVNHRLQPQADDWAVHCHQFCVSLDVSLQVEQLDCNHTDTNLEATARAARYHWFERVLDENQILLTAHHSDDQAETFLLRMMRGSGVAGFAAILPERQLSSHKSSPRVIRPLLGFTHQSLKDFALDNKLNWVDDPSNMESVYDRNFVRLEVIQTLQARWPAVTRMLGRSSAHMHDAAKLLAELADSDIKTCHGKLPPSLYCFAHPLSLTAILLLTKERVSNLLRHWIKQHHLPAISYQQLAQWFDQVYYQPNCQRSIVTWQGIQLRCFKQHIFLIRVTKSSQLQQIKWNGSVIQRLDHMLQVTTKRTNQWGIDPEVVHSAKLTWRQRHGGEVCLLPGRRHHSSLKKLYQAKQVPPWQRHRCPLLVDVDDQIVWAHTIGVCDIKGITSQHGGLLPQLTMSALNTLR